VKNLDSLIRELIKLPNETEWVEFKHNNDNPEDIGEYISALSNSATLHDKDNAYVIWGVDNDTHNIVGTSFNYRTQKKGNQDLEHWLRQLLSDNANFSFHFVEMNNKQMVLLVIYKAIYRTVTFKGIGYIRVGSSTPKLKDHPMIESNLWDKINRAKYEEMLAKQDLQATEALSLLDYTSYFDLTNTPIPGETDGILHYMLEDKLIVRQDNSLFAITNLGAILFAKRLAAFDSISRKSVRVIQYKGTDKINTIREDVSVKGYASGFEELLKYIEGLLPTKEEIDGALRKSISVYPSIAIRELVANALIHQNLSITGTGPTIEIFDNRIEITNPGIPLVDHMRFIDNPPRSRNEMLASLMRRAHICEERGSGWDKIALHCESYQLPAPKIDTYDEHTKVTVYSHIPFGKIPLGERLWSCYMHACLKQVSGEQMTNPSLRNRFGVTESNKSAISRLIAASIEEGLIKPLDPETSRRYRCYIPFWA